MKSVNVKKSPAVLGLSKKSKDNLKIKKKPSSYLSTSSKKVLSQYLSVSNSNPDHKTNVNIVEKKNSQKTAGNSPRKSKKDEKKMKNTSPQIQKKDNKKQSKAVNSQSIVKQLSTQNVEYLDSKKVTPAVQALMTHCKTKNKNALFKSEGTPIFVQFEAIAVPKHPKTTLRVVLPHSPHSKVADVLLIITDEKKHHRKLRHDDEMYIINFTEKLKKLGVTQVSKVMTLRQIRAEYYTHEMRRKLSDMFDVYLVDGKLAPKLSSLIGRNFYKMRKNPIPVSLEKEDKIKLEIERGLRKTQIVLKSTCCTNSICTIGSTDMKPEEIAENLEAFSKALDTCKYPGGWRNVKAVHIKTPTSSAFPVYYSFVTPNEIENAELKQTLPKHSVAVKGELSTIGRDVTVRPDGSIEVEGVDDMRSLMHQLYKHAGFKDHEDLDLTDAEYKEVVKELQKHIPVKPKPEDRNAPTEKDVADMLGSEDSSSDEDDNTIEGEIQREDNVHGDFEDGEDEDEEEEEKGDGVEQSYMQQWQETWLNQDSEDEQDTGEGGKQKNKNVKNKNMKNSNKKQEQKGKANNNKRKQGTESEQVSKKQKTGNVFGKQGGKKADKASPKMADKHGLKKADKWSVKMTDKQSLKKADKQILKMADKQSVKKAENLNKSKSKKDTPLRQANKGGAKNAAKDPVVQKKKSKKAGSKTPNYIPL